MKKIGFFVALLPFFSNLYAEVDTHPCCDRGTFEIGADWLYWKSFQDDLEYASRVTSTGGEIQSMLEAPHFNTNSGFRLFVDYTFCNNPWTIGAIFTHVKSTFAQSLFLDPNNITNDFIIINSDSFAIFTVFNDGNVLFSSMESSGYSKLNYFDVDMSRLICMYSCFEISSHMGLRGLWLRQKLFIDGATPQGAGGTFSSDFTETYSGFGLEGGLNANFHLGCGFSLVGQLGGSLLYARINVSEDLSPILGGLPIIHTERKICHLSPTIDGFIGLEYENCLWYYPINVHLGWEHHLIMNANHFKLFSYSDLTFQGLTLGASIGF